MKTNTGTTKPTTVTGVVTEVYAVTRFTTTGKPCPDVRYFTVLHDAVAYAHTMRNAQVPPTINTIHYAG